MERKMLHLEMCPQFLPFSYEITITLPQNPNILTMPSVPTH